MFALALAGCGSIPGAVHELDAAAHAQCGWLEAEALPPEALCFVYSVPADCGALPVGEAPCEHVPARELRVEAGQLHTEWHRRGASCPFTMTQCSAQ